MRLLNTSTLELHEFIGCSIPTYAILSHLWEEEELTYSDLTSAGTPPFTHEACRKKAGFAKVANFCRVAEAHHISYGWVDTCCIDKSSSSELSEAINSMYRWYRNAAIYFTYLADVPSPEQTELREPEQITYFQNSRWFTRGWTLQELLAPRVISFLNRDWNVFGTKDRLYPLISQITGIRSQILSFKTPLVTESAAHKMSWASKRATTREEDMAYSLIGLFDVSMPLLYGEGARRAFHRLQRTIFEQHPDESLLAWGEWAEGAPPLFERALAPSSESFAAYSRHMSPPGRSYFRSRGRTEISLTSRGMTMVALLAHPRNQDSDAGDCLLPLNFSYSQNGLQWFHCLPLKRLQFPRHTVSNHDNPIPSREIVHPHHFGLRFSLRGSSDKTIYVKRGFPEAISEHELLSMKLTESHIEVTDKKDIFPNSVLDHVRAFNPASWLAVG